MQSSHSIWNEFSTQPEQKKESLCNGSLLSMEDILFFLLFCARSVKLVQVCEYEFNVRSFSITPYCGWDDIPNLFF